jgi:hypothetical protein
MLPTRTSPLSPFQLTRTTRHSIRATRRSIRRMRPSIRRLRASMRAMGCLHSRRTERSRRTRIRLRCTRIPRALQNQSKVVITLSSTHPAVRSHDLWNPRHAEHFGVLARVNDTRAQLFRFARGDNRAVEWAFRRRIHWFAVCRQHFVFVHAQCSGASIEFCAAAEEFLQLFGISAPQSPRLRGDRGASLITHSRSPTRPCTSPREGHFPCAERDFAFSDGDFASK